jgi:N-acetylglucosamine-6-phosphate deacetylase
MTNRSSETNGMVNWYPREPALKRVGLYSGSGRQVQPVATTYAAATVVTPDGVLSPGWVSVAGSSVRSVGAGRPTGTVLDLGSVALVPGFVDLHSHGGGGAAFTDGIERAGRVLATHLQHGTTSMVASLVSDSVDVLETQVRELAPLVASGDLLGVHLEGPWLSDKYAGAHDRSVLRDPVMADVDRLLDAGPVAMVTLAVERTGGPEAVRRLVGRDVVVALGHSDASYEEAHSAVDAGATVATHLLNAARPIHHREPGLVVALLERSEVTVEMIADGVHLHEAVVRDVARLVGRRLALVTDAMAAAGLGDGDYRLGRLGVRVRDGVARVAEPDGSTGPIAGSSLTLDRALRFAVRSAGLDLAEASHAVSGAPADALRRPDLGRIAPEARADLVALDDDLDVVAVMRRGSWVKGGPTRP